MADKRRFVGPSGAVFVPRVDEETIRLKVAAGEWTEIQPPAKPEPKPAASRTTGTK